MGSGRTMALIGLRMMPTFPSSPLRFRTAGFPRYGSKAGLSVGAFPGGADRSAPRRGLHPTFASPALRLVLARSRGATRVARRHRASGPAALPQGPSLRSGLCCPALHAEQSVIRQATTLPMFRSRCGSTDARRILPLHIRWLCSIKCSMNKQGDVISMGTVACA